LGLPRIEVGLGLKHFAAGIEALLELFWPILRIIKVLVLWAKKRLPKARPLPKNKA